MDTIRLVRVSGEQFKFSHAEKAVIMSAAGTGDEGLGTKIGLALLLPKNGVSNDITKKRGDGAGEDE